MRRQKRRTPYVINIDNLSHEGRGIGRLNGKTVFVNGALPQETVLARTTKRRGSFEEAIALEIKVANADRIEPRCPHTGVCGGCSLQHLSTAKQIEHKQAVLFELLAHHAGVTSAIRLPAVRGPQWGYRRKARLGVKVVPKKGGALVGFREKAAPYIADIESCVVLDPVIGERLLDLRQLIDGLSISDRIPQIEVAIGDYSAALVFRHLLAFNDDDIVTLARFQKSTGIGVYLQPGAEHTVHRLNDATIPLSYEVDGLRFDFLPTDFTQVNGAINRTMVNVVLEQLRLKATDRILDLFCGLGNFSLPLAQETAQVIGIEGSESMVRRAQKNALRNNIGNVRFRQADLSDTNAVADIDMRGITKLLLDPPRTGADEIVKRLDLEGLDRIVYGSCNPVTLARDAKSIRSKSGLKLVCAGVLDMFPHTSHVESIAVFEKS